MVNMMTDINTTIKKANSVRRRLINRLIKPEKPDRQDRMVRYERRLQKWNREIVAITMIMSRLAKSWRLSIKLYNANPNHVREIRITSLAILLCGNFKLIPVMIKNERGKYVPTGELAKAPTSDTFREEVLLLIDCFFDRVDRGGIGEGASTWRPKREPRLSSASVEILLSLADTYKNLFDQVKEALLGKEPENMIDKICFDIFVDEGKIKCLIDKLME